MYMDTVYLILLGSITDQPGTLGRGDMRLRAKLVQLMSSDSHGLETQE